MTSKRTASNTAFAPTSPFVEWSVQMRAELRNQSDVNTRLAVRPRKRSNLFFPLLAGSESRRTRIERHEQGLDRRL